MKPLTRLEQWLAKIAGDEDAGDITPISRKEYYLNEIAQKAIGGGEEPFVVTFSGSTEYENAECDKTFSEIEEAYNSGKKIELYYQCPGVGENAVITFRLISGCQTVDNALTGVMGAWLMRATAETYSFANISMTESDLVIQTNLM